MSKQKYIKTYRIGEYCRHGILVLKAKEDSVTVELKDYFTKKVEEKETFTTLTKLRIFMENASTYYHADKAMIWLQSKNIKLSI